MTKKKILIIGGGYIGTKTAQTVQDWADVTLIEQREAFTHTPSMIRALVDPRWLEKSIIPYDRLLKTGRVKRGKVVEVTSEQVALQSGERFSADYVVVATGSQYASPFKPAGDSADAIRIESQKWHQALINANRIVIVGAGAVGVELAGEIAFGLPGKQITVVSEDSSLFPNYPPALGAKLKTKLEKNGVEFALGTRATELASASTPYSGDVTLADGRMVQGDIVFPVIGSKPNTGLLEGLPGVKIGALGRIKTDGWMRPSDLPHVFAAGDVVDMGDGMTIVGASRQISWLTATLKALGSGKPLESRKPYKPWKTAPILLPLGPRLGNSYLPFGVAGDFLTRQMKGKDLFITTYQKMFGRS